MTSGYRDHGYGSHRRESFARYYRRNLVSEGCGCGERVLDLANRPSDPLGLVRLAGWATARVTTWLAGRLGRRGRGTKDFEASRP
jgi:hypothetical protein